MFLPLPRLLQSVGVFFSNRLTRLRCTVPPQSGQVGLASFLATRGAASEGRSRPSIRMPTTTARMTPVPATDSQRRRVGVEVIGALSFQARVGGGRRPPPRCHFLFGVILTKE